MTLKRYDGTVVHLSLGQIKTLKLIAQGMTTEEIAQQRGLSPSTIGSIRVDIRAKVGLRKVDRTGRDLLQWMKWNGLWVGDQDLVDLMNTRVSPSLLKEMGWREDAGLYQEEADQAATENGSGRGVEGDGPVHQIPEPGRQDPATGAVGAPGDGGPGSGASQGATTETAGAERPADPGHGGDVEMPPVPERTARKVYSRKSRGGNMGNDQRTTSLDRRPGAVSLPGSFVRGTGNQNPGSVPQQADIKVTTWRCEICLKHGSFKHTGLTGDDLVDEIRVYHQMASPSCRFWDMKVRIRTM